MKSKTTTLYLFGALTGDTKMGGLQAVKRIDQPVDAARCSWSVKDKSLPYILNNIIREHDKTFRLGAQFTSDTVLRIERSIGEGDARQLHVREILLTKLQGCSQFVNTNIDSKNFLLMSGRRS
jgi:hypothetical protein